MYKRQKKNYWVTVIPATFMSAVSATYFMAAPECMGILWKAINFTGYYPVAVVTGIVFAALMLLLFMRTVKKQEKVSPIA